LIDNPQLIGLAIGIGMGLSLILTETLGVTAGGVIVPGYIALYIHEPYKVIITFSVALIVLLIIRVLSNFMFIYGKRRLVLSLMLGFLFGYLSKIYLDSDLSSIGNIIPGLLASWMDRQGVLQTVSVLIIIAVATRLILIALLGGQYYV
tara:strand:- start:1475 stop:1921 length:447 start_codon:yes stop_codon:yes gene_type:complete